MPKTAYLTIDDGPSPFWKQKIDFLVENAISAVWFCEGQALEAHSDFAVAAIRAGQIIGNHSYDHPTFSGLTVEECEYQIRRTDILIEECYARAKATRPAKFFRFPYGDKGGLTFSDVFSEYEGEGRKRKDELQAILTSLGYRQPDFTGITYSYYREAELLVDVDWYWTFDCGESVLTEDPPPVEEKALQTIFARMQDDQPERGRGLKHLGSEDIVLIHDHAQTTRLFPLIIGRMLSMEVCFSAVPIR